ncbi:hypothetical protein VV089_11385 [Candidatus Merdisoma sp. JLR.KK011]|uniref:hypothetical protein n=1 Tax=Candidatus Merdisoma sp. JLR.KK011 TaxID=3114299 RepID=UPI002FF0A54A
MCTEGFTDAGKAGGNSPQRGAADGRMRYWKKQQEPIRRTEGFTDAEKAAGNSS